MDPECTFTLNMSHWGVGCTRSWVEPDTKEAFVVAWSVGQPYLMNEAAANGGGGTAAGNCRVLSGVTGGYALDLWLAVSSPILPVSLKLELPGSVGL